MTEESEAIKRLERYAQAIARKLLWKYDLGHDDARHEDITQSLLLAGWQAWRDTGDEAKARHRMSSRAVNEEKKLNRELRQPRPVGSLGPPPASREREGTDETERYHTRREDVFSRVAVSSIVRSNPLEDKVIQEYLDDLPERRRQVLQMQMAMMTVPEIATKLGVSTRTVERELAEIRKDNENEHAE